MSDFEATRSRAQAGAPITAVASGKLRSLAGNGTLFAETDTLVDAFAEVFAQIAASSPKTVDPGDQAVPCRCVGDTKDTKPAEDDDDNATELSDAKEASDDRVSPLILDVAPQTDGDRNTGGAELAESTEAESESLDVEHTGDEELKVAAIESKQPEAAVASDEGSAEPAAQLIVETDDTNKRNRDRRETPAVDVAETTRQRGQGGTAESEQKLENEYQIDQGEEQTLSQTSEGDEAETDRVSRRRYTGNKQAPDNVGATHSPRAGEGRHANAAGGLPAPESVVDSSGQSTQSSTTRPPSNHIEPVIATVQNVTSRVDRINAPGGNQATSRGPSQPLEAATLRRNEPRAEPSSKPAKQSAADTVSRVKLIQRVSKAFQHLGPEGGVVRLRLAPAEMGAVRVEMRINQRKVQARVVAETEAASAALREHLPDLRARLESFGMQIEKLEIETEANEQQHGSWFDDSHQDQQQWQQQGRRRFERQPSIERRDVSPKVSPPPTDHGVRVTCGMDVRL